MKLQRTRPTQGSDGAMSFSFCLHVKTGSHSAADDVAVLTRLRGTVKTASAQVLQSITTEKPKDLLMSFGS